MIQTNGFKQIKLGEKETIEKFTASDGLSLQCLFFAMYNEFPSLYTYRTDEAHSSYHFDTHAILDSIKETYGENNVELVIYTSYNIISKKEESGLNIFVPDKQILARIEKDPGETYILYRNGNEKEVEKLTEIFISHYKRPELPPNNVYTVAYDNSFYLNKLPTKDFSSLDTLKNYNNDFIAENDIIKNFVGVNDESGLVILHGDKGTGKSTYIRHLISSNPEKKFVYIPASMIEILSQPNFSTFLMTLQNHIIILEDCEEAIKDRKANGTPASVSLLLNMTDGLLSDGLGLKFICTFNDDVRNIDTALLRKGRLVSKYEFKALCTEKTNELLEELYGNDWKSGKYDKEPISDKPLSLADIYNFYKSSYEKERKKII